MCYNKHMKYGSHSVLQFSFRLCMVALLSGALFAQNFVWAATNPSLSDEINQLDSTIKQKRSQLEALKNQQAEYQKALQKKQAEKANLQNQLELIEGSSAQTQLKLDQARIDIETTNLEMQKVSLEIVEQDKKISESKENLSSALKLLSQEDDKSQLEILLMNNHLTDYVSQLRYLEDINGKIADSVDSLRSAKATLEDNSKKLEDSRERLRVLKTNLESQQVTLAEEKDAKSFLLDQTKNSEAEFQKQVAEFKRQQQSASADVANLERTLRDKINSQSGTKPDLKFNGFIWPIPSHRITAYFHDPDYPFLSIMQHSAIDIGTPQGTPIKAPASGYVGRAKDGGMGYSYIMLLHDNNLSTVFGHVSKIYVKEDEYVSQGQIIGLSGATPGTPGAGPFTTGAHLHLEVRVNGIPTDPLKYFNP